MMDDFIVNDRENMLAGCRAKRFRRSATAAQPCNGIPLFLEQLERTLDAQEQGNRALGQHISGATGGDLSSRAQVGVSATAHGQQLLDLGFTVAQGVHDHGNLCQAITDLAVDLDVRNRSGGRDQRTALNVEALLAEAAAALHAQVAGCRLELTPVAPDIEVTADRHRIMGAIANLLQNAIKSTASGTLVTLGAQAYGTRVLIEVSEHGSGLPPGIIERVFPPFTQRSTDRSGLGLGLAIARDSVELEGGTLTARDVHGTGCVFTLSLPRNRPAGRVDDVS
jgi:signal transduction histidine kinase